MKRLIWRTVGFVFVVVLLSVALLISGRTMAAEPPPPGTSSQEIGATGPDKPGAPGTSSQGTEAQAPLAPGAPLDDRSLFPDATVSFYHIPGSVLTPVDSATALSYDLMGCVHATAGAGYLLNAPLEIPDGSQIVLLRLYYDDVSTSDMNSWITRYNEPGTDFEDLVHVPSVGTDGHSSNYGNLDHIVDTYSWSYVLNVRLNTASNELQVCGLRVMYYAPSPWATFLPNIVNNSHP